MKLENGPAFGAAIIGVGLTWLLRETGRSWSFAIGIGVLAAIVDYVLVILIARKKSD